MCSLVGIYLSNSPVRFTDRSSRYRPIKPNAIKRNTKNPVIYINRYMCIFSVSWTRRNRSIRMDGYEHGRRWTQYRDAFAFHRQNYGKVRNCQVHTEINTVLVVIFILSPCNVFPFVSINILALIKSFLCSTIISYYYYLQWLSYLHFCLFHSFLFSRSPL